jgi:hypothetical protein
LSINKQTLLIFAAKWDFGLPDELKTSSGIHLKNWIKITGGQSRGNPIVGTIDEMFTAFTFTIQRWIQSKKNFYGKRT